MTIRGKVILAEWMVTVPVLGTNQVGASRVEGWGLEPRVEGEH